MAHGKKIEGSAPARISPEPVRLIPLFLPVVTSPTIEGSGVPAGSDLRTFPLIRDAPESSRTTTLWVVSCGRWRETSFHAVLSGDFTEQRAQCQLVIVLGQGASWTR